MGYRSYINRIKATSSYEMKGLNLTKAKFHTAKNVLLANGFVEDVDSRNDKGQFKAPYIKIHYLRKNVVLDTDYSVEAHPPINPEDGLPILWKNQSAENRDTNTNDKNGNAIDKKVNAGNEKRNNNSKTFSEKASLGAKEEKPLTQEEQQAQEIIDAIKTECGLDLKDKHKWKEQVSQIAEVQIDPTQRR